MINPDRTIVQVLGPGGVTSPLRLAHGSDQRLSAFVPDEARVRYQVETGTGQDLHADIFFEKAGPRKRLFFEPRETKAAIVTCGGCARG
jgi:6-phosphofructokinase 1